MLQSETVKKYDTYKDSGIEWIGKIPQNWNVRKLFGLLKSIGSGTTPKGNDSYYDGDIPWLNTGDLTDSYVNIIGKTVTDIAMTECSALKLFDKNSVVIAMYGATIGKLGIITFPTTTNQACCVMSCSKSLYNKYLFYVLYSARDYILTLSYGAGQPNISQETMKSFKLCCPDVVEQQKIAEYLDKKCGEIDRVIETEKLVIEKLKEYKQSIITEAVTKGLNKSVQLKDSGIEYLGNIPSKWNIKRLRYLATCQNGISKSGEYFGEGSPFVSYGDVYNNNVLPETVEGLCMVTETEKENYSVKTNDIFFTRTSETIEEIARTCVCKKTIEDATFAGFLIRVRPYTGELIVDYSKYYFASEIHRKFFVKEMNLVTRASLSQELLKKLPVLIPPKEEQQQIAEYLDKKCSEIDKAISDKEQVIEKFTEYKKSLIYECVTGKKRV